MSYSFRIQATDKDELKRQVVEKFNEIVGQQACHVADRNQGIAATHAFIDVLQDDPERDVMATVSGYLSGQWQQNELVKINTASFNVCVSHIDRV